MSLCSYCEGEGEVHDPLCLSNQTYDVNDCDCNPDTCPDCHGKRLRRNKRGINKVKEEEN